MHFLRLSLGPFETNSYVVFCPETRQGVIIDPGFETETILAAVEREKLRIIHILDTHAHIDHTCGNALAREKTGATVLMHRDDLDLLRHPDQPFLLALGLGDYTPAEPDGFLQQGQEIRFGRECFCVIHTPGHTPGGVCLLGQGALFAGDTLFAGSVGRTDLLGGDETLLLRSIRDRILSLPDETTIQPGHGPATTVGEERRFNPFLAERS